MREVRKAIFLLKAHSEEGVPLLLNTLSADWHIRLFPNANVPDDPSSDNSVLRQLLGERLRISPESVELQLDRQDTSMSTEQIKETADPEKRAKYGPLARYTFYYCTVCVKNPPPHLLQPTFKVGDVAFTWTTLNALKSDDGVRRHNSDVLEFVSSTFDQTLTYLPAAFLQKIRADQGRVFISYAKEDRERVLLIHEYLQRRGLNAFIDVEFLKIGDDWEDTILDQIKAADFFIICLSEYAVRKTGFIHKELAFARELQELLPEDRAFILPVRLNECDPPRSLARYQYKDWFTNDTTILDRIVADIIAHAAKKAERRAKKN